MCVLITGRCNLILALIRETLLPSERQQLQRLMDDQSTSTRDIWGLSLNNASVPSPLRSGEQGGRKGRKYLRARRQGKGLQNPIFWSRCTSCNHELTPTTVACTAPTQAWTTPKNGPVNSQARSQEGPREYDPSLLNCLLLTHSGDSWAVVSSCLPLVSSSWSSK